MGSTAQQGSGVGLTLVLALWGITKQEAHMSFGAWVQEQLNQTNNVTDL